MIHSMTGFANNQIILSRDGKQSIVSAQLKSLNSRFFELTCKLPPALQYLETVFLKMMKEKLSRGHFYLQIHINNPQIFVQNIEPLAHNVDAYVTGLEKIKHRYNLSDPLTLEHIIRLPYIFTNEEVIADKTIEASMIELIESLIQGIIKARSEEGIGIAKDIHVRIKNISVLIDGIETAAHIYLEKTKIKLNDNIEKNIGNLDMPNKNQTLLALLDKIDIHEEISRFKSHIEHMQKQLYAPSIEKGKVLDFIIQEMVREINTIGSKCPDATISIHTINTKVEIEKIREQIQNVV